MKFVRVIQFAILVICWNAMPVFGQKELSQGHANSLQKVILSFQEAIIKKDSTSLKSLFFDDKVPFVGIMSPQTEQSIKKNYPDFEGIAVSNSSKFISEICSSPKNQEEKFFNVNIQSDSLLAFISFDYSFWSNGTVIQWGNEHWSLVFAENRWFITGVNYSIRFPKVEKIPAYMEQ